MEEKERYVYHEVSNEVETYECYWDNQECCELFDDKAVLNRLNEQDYELKKLNQENIKLIKENQQLKQSQKQTAIEELEKVRDLLFNSAIQITGTSVDCVRLYTINQIFKQEIEKLKGD